MFAQPWAWLGLAGLAVPVLIHLLTRHQAVRTRVPSVRFIDAADVTFVSLRSLTDIPLLLLRAAILAAAVAAIAGPRWSARPATGAGRIVAVVVDASQGALSDASRTAARTAVAGAAQSTTVESVSLAAGIASASRWLERQSGARELVVVSDFARGALTAEALAVVPAGVGIRFDAQPLVRVPLPEGFALRGEQSRMAWRAATAAPMAVTVRAGAAQAQAEAMLTAMSALVSQASVDASARRIALVFPGAPDHAAVVAAPPIDQPWMFDVLRPLLADPALSAAVSAHALNGELAIAVAAEPQSEAAAAIAASVLRSVRQPLAWSEFEPETIPPSQLQQWARPTSEVPVSTVGDAQGHWLWLVVLVLLAVEWWVRRQRVSPRGSAVARVA